MTAAPVILIVDDDSRTHLLLEAALETIGAQLYYATTSQDGIRLARDILPQLILLDLRLPAPSIPGWDMVALLKRDPVLAPIPVLVITASGGDAIMRAMKAGADDFIEKPFSIDQLRRKVTRVVKLAQN